MLLRLIENVLALFLLEISVKVVPERYAKKAGIIGNIHGATNEPSPARTAIARVISAMNKSNNLAYKAFFQIYSTSYSVAFYSSIKYSST
ncbi:MAG: hypothetical protein NPMRTH4_1140004 [Nitrosopumilales archaeon]|nr:MAG: hypothetical protein NPMRTH4_1140004 [Nitrosopumilales archaeon]